MPKEISRRSLLLGFGASSFGGLLAPGAGAETPSSAPDANRASSGSHVIGSDDLAHQRTPFATVTSVHSKLRHIVFAEEDYGFKPGGDPAKNSRALERAVSDAQIINLPSSTDPADFSSMIRIPPHTRIQGSGSALSRVRALGEHGFLYEAPKGTSYIQGPEFKDFALEATGSGIKLNDAKGGFTDNGDTQCYIGRPLFSRIVIRQTSSADAKTNGIELNKVFSAVIDQCEIVGFTTGVKLLGCDFPEIRGRTRIWNCDVLIEALSVGTFGSGLKLDGCDLLLAKTSFIRSSDRHLLVSGCYFEAQSIPAAGPALDITLTYSAIFQNNRIEIQAAQAPRLISVKGDGALFVFQNNSNAGPGWGALSWNNGDGARYYFTPLRRQRIIVSGNEGGPLELPYQTDDVANPRSERIDPSTDGLLPDDYGQFCRVREKAFVLPASPSFASVITFNAPPAPRRSRSKLMFKAKAEVEGQHVACQLRRGKEIIATAYTPLGLKWRWYEGPIGINSDEEIKILFYNDDIGKGGNVLIESIFLRDL